MEPDAEAPAHDEEHRRHEGHRHRRTASSGAASSASEPWSGASEGGPPPQPQSLERVAQEVYGRLVSGPRRAGSGLWQASVPGAKASGGSGTSAGRGNDAWPAGSDGFIAAGHAAAGRTAGQPAAANGLGRPSRHRKTMSLDTGTAAAAQEAAAAALLERQLQQQQQQRHRAGGSKEAAAGSPPLPPGWSPHKQPLERRPSDMANAAAMASMQRAEHHVRAPSRLACFGGCGRRPAVKD